MPKTHRPYPSQFRQQMVELVQSGRTPEQLAQEYEPSAAAIRNWVTQYARDAGLSSAERQELRRLRQRISAIWRDHRQVYGRPRIHAELRAQGERVGAKWVARLMQQAGIAGVSRRRAATTTRRAAAPRPAPDLVPRDFNVAVGDRLWVADIT